MSANNPFSSGYATPGSSRSFSGGSRGGQQRQYMTVGSGSTSESAARLQAMLDEDSGYGGSVADGEAAENVWHPGPSEDRFTPDHTPVKPGESNVASENERRVVASHVHQLFYNQNRTALARAINQTVETLRKLQDMNAKWPAHYPSVQRAPSPPALQRPDVRPGMHHTQSTADNHRELERPPSRPHPLKRAGTSLGELQSAESSSQAAAKVPEAAPRLVTPQLAQEFSVLKIELKMAGLAQSEIVHSLEKQSVAALLDNQINNSIRHLFSLRERIEDTSSKVLITGDLNAGKSTFCNALLRRKILPEDQQPCTSIFCEVLSFTENAEVEEVHAIPHGFVYNRNDESTYSVFALKQLEDIVVDGDRWSQCKIYVKDIRPVDQSLLTNGVVDIALIDAPGLNNDSLKTTALFARQEEIDVVVFVVSAANHFTLSAKEFIFNAAREKAYMFMVVNGFDNIRDKRRCQEMILKQINQLSPATFKESSELVHFVSSNAIPVAPAPGEGPGGDFGGSGSGGASFGGGGGKPDPEDDEGPSGKHGEPGSPPKKKGKGKEKEAQDDFNELETSLRRFVLEKRARSKLAPAKTYLHNVLGDLHTLASVNRDVAQNELDRVTDELKQLEPVFEKSKQARSEADDQVASNIEGTANEVYTLTRNTLTTSIAHVAESDLGVQYSGVFGAYNYADDVKAAMLSQVAETVRWCEERAREKTVQGVSSIKSLGLLHLGDDYVDLTFRSEKMFRSRRDALARQVDFETEVWDFFDLASLWERQEKVAGTSMAVTVAGVVGGRMLGGVGWLDGALTAGKIVGTSNLRRVILPGIVLGMALGVSYAISQIPTSLPRRLSAKLSAQLAQLDYTHANSTRISGEVRRALRYPADKLREGLQRSVEHLQEQRRETVKVQVESEVARKYFGNLGSDNTFGRFPQDFASLLHHALPKIAVQSLQYPRFETRGDLRECVAKFKEWLQDRVIELEVANGTPAPTVDPSVHVILCGHSMGGIVAAETLLSIANDRPVQPAYANDTTNKTTGHEEDTRGRSRPTNLGAGARDERPSSAPPPESSRLFFPYVQALLAFDTPYLGISPGVLAHGAEDHIYQASTAYKAFDTATSLFGWNSPRTQSPQRVANASAKGLPAPGADNATAWGWGKYAMVGGAAAAIAGAAGAAYLSRNQIQQGFAWAGSHLEFIGCLARGAELQNRVEKLVELKKTHGVGFANFYGSLDQKISSKTQYAGAVVGADRTFCVVPKDAARADTSPTGTKRRGGKASAERPASKRRKTAEEANMAQEMEEGEQVQQFAEDTSKSKGDWVKCINSIATDELKAHTSLFAPHKNPDYHAMLPRARKWVVAAVDKGWYESASGRDEEDASGGAEEEIEAEIEAKIEAEESPAL
ncbi:mitofusin [Teratosphaeriaceae sp. CCFEE 6253]|nr:mitofusin [Teratosphaeriaceae sp. CCFEE 6253]